MWSRDPFDEIYQPERRHQPVVLMFLTLLALLFCFQVCVNLYAITNKDLAPKLAQLPYPPWAFGLQALCGALNLMWIAAMFLWQRLGYYGFILTSLGMTAINLLCEMEPKLAALPLVFVALLFLALHIGGRRSMWQQMR